ncbi:SRPBCC domain-containing protein [Angustibacter sp. McL0619]|uniref:SRPBCC domain-containing protein n=1 Tax=Angustibacter sp. McL0619 TaxID=3415676 RepID=UPI003CF2CE30
MNDPLTNGLNPVQSEAVDARWAVVLTRQLRQGPARVWTALTDPHGLAGWTPYTADRDLSTPGPANLTMTDGSSGAPLDGTVLTAQPPYLLEHHWGEDVLRWELVESGGGTLLTLRHTTSRRAELASFAAGWHLCLDTLDLLLAGTPRKPVVGERARDFGWAELEARYREVLTA